MGKRRSMKEYENIRKKRRIGALWRTLMRNLVFICFCLPFVFAAPVFAQDDQPEFKMPCPEVLKLGLDKFMEAYGEKTNDYSTLGQKLAFTYYVDDCKRPENDKNALRLSPERRQQIDDVRLRLSQIGNASWSIAYIEAGGGTMYSLASVGAYAVREDVMGTIIADALVERKLPAARRRANVFVARTRRNLPSSKPQALEHWDKDSRADQLKSYREDVALIRSAFSRLEVIIRALPDKAAALVARRMADELDASLEE